MIGYKGFNKDLTTRAGVKFELGQKTIHEGAVKATSIGLHACSKLRSVLSWYADIKSHRYFKVAMGGTIDNDANQDLYACSEITLLEEVNIIDALTLEMISIFKRLNEQHFDNKAILTGSCALWLTGYKLERIPTDLDIILPYYMQPVGIPCEVGGSDGHKKYYLSEDSISYDLFIQPKQTYTTVEGIKVGNIKDLLIAKVSYINWDSMNVKNDKHFKDIQLILSKMNKVFTPIVEILNKDIPDLPF